MTVAALRLYSYGLDRSRGDVPIFATATAAAAAGGGTGTTPASLTFSNVKVRRDPYPQSVEVSIDASNMPTLELCDTAVVRMGSTDRWYWITGYEEVTNSAYPNSTSNRMNVRIALEYIPVTTGLSLASTVDILPERLPSATPRMVQNWTQSIMLQATPTVALPALPKLGTIVKGSGLSTATTGLMWCEVSFVTGNSVKRYGMFISNKAVYGSSFTHHIFAGPGNSTGDYDLYPSLAQVMSDPITYLGISGATVTDVNISEFCPYKTVKATTNNGIEQYIRIVSKNNTQMTPTNVYTFTGMKYHIYDLTSSYIDWAGTGNEGSVPQYNKGSITVTLSSYEAANGQLSVKDSMRNDIITFPREITGTSMSINYFVYSDSNNIYLTLEYEGCQVTLPGYKIPWATSMWDTYRSFSLQFDRQALQNNIDAANREMNIALTDAATNGIIGGAVSGAMVGGAAGAGLGAFTGVSSLISGAVSGNIRREETIRKLTRDQELTEQRMKGGASTMNNTGTSYGVIRMINEYGGASLIYKAPADFTETEYNAQTAEWGYPSNKVKQSTVSLTAGYWKGRITTFANTMNNTSAGELNNMMVEQFDNGLRLKKVS